MILIFVRTIIIYVLVLFVMRFMGKREIGQMQPFELVIAIMIADLASTPMSEIGIPILYGIINASEVCLKWGRRNVGINCKNLKNVSR